MHKCALTSVYTQFDILFLSAC